MNRSINGLVLLVALSFGSMLFGYRYSFTNVTDKTLVIKVRLGGIDADFFNIVQPGRRTEFNWGIGNLRAGYCLAQNTPILIGEFNPRIAPYFPGTSSFDLPLKNENEPEYGYDDDMIMQAIDARGQWFYALGRQPLHQPKVTFIAGQSWGNFERRINKAIDQLARGAALTVEEALKAAEIVDLDGAISRHITSMIISVVDLIKIGKCRSYHFDILEVDGTIELFTKE